VRGFVPSQKADWYRLRSLYGTWKSGHLWPRQSPIYFEGFSPALKGVALGRCSAKLMSRRVWSEGFPNRVGCIFAQKSNLALVILSAAGSFACEWPCGVEGPALCSKLAEKIQGILVVHCVETPVYSW